MTKMNAGMKNAGVPIVAIVINFTNHNIYNRIKKK
ncbi:hypothetical protein MBCUT_02640 [Methanobrevibacter cuticularis]|uniref:Uncharacterized protein n=1 Tax=Methanobrevibacter cuticularis TaxID=47311 RepID=A0A166F7J0_9EURY|nr:hypothetical protein MBCUT_02640 [Methanobrevibacter cuticularis]